MTEAHYAFMFLGFVLTLFNARVFWALRKRLLVAFPRDGKFIAIVIGLICGLLLSPTLALTLGGVSALRAFRDETPIWLAITCMATQFAFWMYGLSLAFVSLPADVVVRWRQLRSLMGAKLAQAEEVANPDRRKVLQRSALVFPAAIVATSGLGAIASQDAPKIGRVSLPLRKDFRALDGLKIAQFSDVHVGSYMSKERLQTLVDTTHSLRPDIIVCTGDLVDNHMNQLDQACEFLKSLKAPRGVFMCMGNHDYIAAMTSADADPNNVYGAYRAAGVDLLVAQSRKVEFNGAHLWMMGTDYPSMRGLPRMLQRTTRQSLDQCLAEVNDDAAPRVVLAHTPAQFHEGQKREIDLMLSGHTHGGQITLGRIGDYGLSVVLPFELYHKGQYDRDGRRLYVNSGYGGWLPVRVNCPPEITLVTLQAS